MTEISIARDFSAFPAGRHLSDGPFTGERFREQVLMPKLRQPENVVIRLDGVEGLPSSFWEEIFGGLVRAGWSPDQLRQRIKIETSSSDLSMYRDLAWRFVDEAASVH